MLLGLCVIVGREMGKGRRPVEKIYGTNTRSMLVFNLMKGNLSAN